MGTLHGARLAFRNLVKTPGYTLAAVITLTLVMAANSAMFSAVYAVLLRPLPIRHTENLVVCWASDQSRQLPVVELSYRNFEDWSSHSKSFTQAAAIGSSTWPALLDGPDGSARLSSAGVSVSFFETLGVVPEYGRTFRADDDVPKAPRVVILSHRTWVTRFGADPQIVGTTIQLTELHTIVGVMPEAFDFPRGTDFWTPVVPILVNSGKQWRADALNDVGVLFVIGRLRAGVTPRMAAEELDGLAGQLERNGASRRFGSGVEVTPFLDYVLGPVRQALWALLAAVGVLLLIGCANVSALMLTRASLRRREHAVRIALGATGRDLAGLWISGAVILSVAGGALGLMTSEWISKAIVAIAPEDVPRLTHGPVNFPVPVFTCGTLFTVAILCGAGPIPHASAVTVVEALNEAARSTPSRQTHRTRSLLVILQIGLTVVLLIAAGRVT